MDPTTLTILAIDDDAGDIEILRRYLESMPVYEVTLIHAPSLDAAQSELTRPEIDIIFLDYRLGAETGHDVLQAIRTSGDIRPIIVLTGQGDEELAVSVMRSGADDYLAKNTMEPKTLWHAIENARGQFVRRKMETRNRELLQELQMAKSSLENKNIRLAELYTTAHQFVDHVSHEFRTPLTVIKEFATIMRDGLAGEVNAEQLEFLEVIVNRVDDLCVLVDDMLDTSKLEAGMLGICRRDTTVAEVVERVRRTLQQRAATIGAELSIDIPPDLPDVFCDAEKAGRVIINLVINALKFCGDPGKVTLTAHAEPDEYQVRVSIIDNGPGLTDENRQKLFQRFKQTGTQAKSGLKGFGLGLSISKELTNLNFGTIDVESTPGEGSKFSFTIPVTERASLLRRYFNVVSTIRSDIAYASMLHINSDAGADDIVLDEIESMILNNTRATDLLFRKSKHQWILLAASNQGDLRKLTDRIQKIHQEARENRPEANLPDISLEKQGPWNIVEKQDVLIETFIAAETTVEPAYA